jgi:hypothetical protein
MLEWVSDCYLMPTQQLFIYSWQEHVNFQWIKWWWGPLCTRPTSLAGYL